MFCEQSNLQEEEDICTSILYLKKIFGWINSVNIFKRNFFAVISDYKFVWKRLYFYPVKILHETHKEIKVSRNKEIKIGYVYEDD